jgi:hypothetical protein
MYVQKCKYSDNKKRIFNVVLMQRLQLDISTIFENRTVM